MLSGFSPIITTASARNEAYLHSLGATHVLDRKGVPLASLASAVHAITPLPITIVYDAISDPDTQSAAYDLLEPGGKLIIVDKSTMDDAKQTPESHREIIGVLGNTHLPFQRAFGARMYAVLTEMLAAGEIKVCDLWSFESVFLCVLTMYA